MNIAQRVVRNTAFQYLDRAVAMLFGLIAIYYLSRYLGAEGYGKYSIVLSFVPMFRIIGEWGLDTITIREVAKARDQADELLGSVFVLKVFLSALAVLVCWAVLAMMGYPPDTTWAVVIYSLFLLFLPVESVAGILSVELRSEYAVLSNQVSQALNLALLLGVIFLNLGLAAIFVAAVLVQGLRYALLFVFARRFVRPRLRMNFSLWKYLALQAWPLGGGYLVLALYQNAPLLLLSKLATEEMAGLYAAGLRLPQMLTFLPMALGSSLFPLMARYFATERPKLAELYQRAWDGVTLFALPLAVGGTLVAGKILLLLFSGKFFFAIPVFQILVWYSALTFYSIVAGLLLIASGGQKESFAITAFTTILLITADLLVIPVHGHIGAALVTTATQAIALIATFLVLWRRLGLRPRFGTWVRGALAAGLMGLSLQGTQNFHVIAQVAVGAVVFFGLALLLRAVSLEELRQLFFAAPPEAQRPAAGVLEAQP